MVGKAEGDGEVSLQIKYDPGNTIGSAACIIGLYGLNVSVTLDSKHGRSGSGHIFFSICGTTKILVRMSTSEKRMASHHHLNSNTFLTFLLLLFSIKLLLLVLEMSTRQIDILHRPSF